MTDEQDPPAEREDSPGYHADSPGYQVEGEGASADQSSGPSFDPERYLDPDDARKRIGGTMPIAAPGLAGYAIDRECGRMVYLGGEIQWDVLDRPSIPGLPSRTGRRAAVEGGSAAGRLPFTAENERAAVRDEVATVRPSLRCPHQLNVRLGDAERELLRAASRACHLPPTALARTLILRGSAAILGDAPDSSP